MPRTAATAQQPFAPKPQQPRMSRSDQVAITALVALAAFGVGFFTGHEVVPGPVQVKYAYGAEPKHDWHLMLLTKDDRDRLDTRLTEEACQEALAVADWLVPAPKAEVKKAEAAAKAPQQVVNNYSYYYGSPYYTADGSIGWTYTTPVISVVGTGSWPAATPAPEKFKLSQCFQ
jgi:hypothetical protein